MLIHGVTGLLIISPALLCILRAALLLIVGAALPAVLSDRSTLLAVAGATLLLVGGAAILGNKFDRKFILYLETNLLIGGRTLGLIDGLIYRSALIVSCWSC